MTQDMTILFTNATDATSSTSSPGTPTPQTLIIITASITGTILVLFLIWTYLYLTTSSNNSNSVMSTATTSSTTSAATNPPLSTLSSWFRTKPRSPTMPLFHPGPQDLHLLREVIWSSPEDTAGNKIGSKTRTRRLPSAAWIARMELRAAALGSHPLGFSAIRRASRATQGSGTSPRTIRHGSVGAAGRTIADVAAPPTVASRACDSAVVPTSRISNLLARRHLSRTRTKTDNRGGVLALALPAIAGYTELHDDANINGKSKARAKDEKAKTKDAVVARSSTSASTKLIISSPKLADNLRARLAERYALLNPGRALFSFQSINTSDPSSNAANASLTTGTSLIHPPRTSSTTPTTTPGAHANSPPICSGSEIPASLTVLSPTIAHRRLLASGPTSGDVVDDLRSPYCSSSGFSPKQPVYVAASMTQRPRQAPFLALLGKAVVGAVDTLPIARLHHHWRLQLLLLGRVLQKQTWKQSRWPRVRVWKLQVKVRSTVLACIRAADGWDCERSLPNPSIEAGKGTGEGCVGGERTAVRLNERLAGQSVAWSVYAGYLYEDGVEQKAAVVMASVVFKSSRTWILSRADDARV